MKKKPLVSIIIASYNKEKFVERCIRSCEKQNYPNLEIIFYDDGSQDNSFNIAKKFKNIKVYRNIKKKIINKFNTYHQINTYNKAFRKSKGKYILLLDSDDFFKKNKVSEIVRFFQKNQSSSIVFDLPIYYYNKLKQVKTIKNFDFDQQQVKDIWPKFPLAGSCISFKREFYKKFFKLINKKKYSMLTLDFRLAVISNTVLNDFKLIDKHLTYYYQDMSGETFSHFKKFNKNWWSRRLQAHKYVEELYGKKRYSIKSIADFYITILVNKFNLFLKAF